jgi:hypothetical protein
MKKPISIITATAIRPIIIMEASSSPKPKWEARAARPIPAARPASGPIQERLGCACGAAGAPACWARLGAAARWGPGPAWRGGRRRLRLAQFLALHAGGFAAAKALGGIRVAGRQRQAKGERGGQQGEGFHGGLLLLGVTWKDSARKI